MRPCCRMEHLPAGVAVLVMAIVGFVFAVWFGLRLVAPWMARALDRQEDEDEGDRND